MTATEPKVQSTWNIGLHSWILQDGNYPDFSVGQTAEFALEYYIPESTAPANCSEDISVKWINDSSYSVVAEAVLQTSELSILNIGILVYRELDSECIRREPDARFRANLYLGVDPFFYFERLSKLPGVPPLIYSWRIESILRQTAPFIEVADVSGPLAGRKVRRRDESKLGYEEISKTNAWEDDGGLAAYLLRCNLLPVAPKHSSATSF